MRTSMIVLLCLVLLAGGCETARKVGDAMTTAGKATVGATVTAGKAVGKTGQKIGETVAEPFEQDEEDEED